MKALSILQPYAWLIANGHKDIENRGWSTHFRGHFLVHAGKRYPKREYAEDVEDFERWYGVKLPAYDDLDRGGVVGQACITDCVREHPSKWKMADTWGFVLTEQKPLVFTPYRGQLGWFDIPREIVAQHQSVTV